MSSLDINKIKISSVIQKIGGVRVTFSKNDARIYTSKTKGILLTITNHTTFFSFSQRRLLDAKLKRENYGLRRCRIVSCLLYYYTYYLNLDGP